MGADLKVRPSENRREQAVTAAVMQAVVLGRKIECTLASVVLQRFLKDVT